jgi:hypothetical protein
LTNVTEILEKGESVSGFCKVPPYQKTLSIEWDLPFCHCRQSYTIPEGGQIEEKPNVLEITVQNVPRVSPVLCPFDGLFILRNTTSKSIRGVIKTKRDNQSLILYGRETINFGQIEGECEKCIDLRFVGRKEGEFVFPEFLVEIEGAEPETIRPNGGVLIFGGD